MERKQFTPAEKVQYWTKKLEDIRRAKAVLEDVERYLAKRLKKAQLAQKQAA